MRYAVVLLFAAALGGCATAPRQMCASASAKEGDVLWHRTDASVPPMRVTHVHGRNPSGCRHAQLPISVTATPLTDEERAAVGPRKYAVKPRVSASCHPAGLKPGDAVDGLVALLVIETPEQLKAARVGPDADIRFAIDEHYMRNRPPTVVGGWVGVIATLAGAAGAAAFEHSGAVPCADGSALVVTSATNGPSTNQEQPK